MNHDKSFCVVAIPSRIFPQKKRREETIFHLTSLDGVLSKIVPNADIVATRTDLTKRNQKDINKEKTCIAY